MNNTTKYMNNNTTYNDKDDTGCVKITNYKETSLVPVETFSFKLLINKPLLDSYISKIPPVNKGVITKLQKLARLVQLYNFDNHHRVEVSFNFIKVFKGRFKKANTDIYNFMSMERILRNAVLGSHFEIDIENCHPTLLLHLFKKYQIVNNNYLDKYISNKVLLAQELEVPLSDLKTSIISLFNRDTIPVGLNKNLLAISNEIHSNIMELHNILFNEQSSSYHFHLEAVMASHHLYNIKGKVMARYLQEIESNILVNMITLLPHYSHLLPLHDGIIVQSEDLITPLQILFLQKQLFLKVGLNIVLKVKQELPITNSLLELPPQDLEVELPNIDFKESDFEESDSEESSSEESGLDLGFGDTSIKLDLPTRSLELSNCIISKTNTVSKDMEEFINSSIDYIKGVVIKDLNGLVWVKNKDVWTCNRPLTFEYLFRLLMNSGIMVSKPNTVLTFFDMFGSVKSYIQNLLLLIPPTTVNVAHKIETNSMGHIMFSCGSLWSIRNRTIVDKDNLYLGGFVDFKLESYIAVTDSKILEVFKVLLNMFYCEEDLVYFLKFVGSAIDGVNSY
jgi:hypothetical protein